MIERHRARFEADPDDAKAFAALEEHWFLRGDWPALVALYWQRLSATGLAQNIPERARLLQRMGQVLEERCLAPDPALACHREAVRLAPELRPALRQLHRALEARGIWEEACEWTEREAALPIPAAEQAALWLEAGRGWRERGGDPARAGACFERVLALDPSQREALDGQASVLVALGRHGEAADAYARLAALFHGPERCAPLTALAQLCEGPLAAPERAAEAWRSVLAEDPNHLLAVERLAAIASAGGQYSELVALQERRFDAAHGARRRTEVALEAARLLADEFGDLRTAKAWLTRAEELADDDVAVQLGHAELARRGGDRQELALRLARVLELRPDVVPVDTWLEAAELAAEQGNTDLCLSTLRRVLPRAPYDARVLDALETRLAAAGRDDELADILEQRAALCSDEPEQQASVLLRLGTLHAERLHDPAAARNALERAYLAWPATAGCLDALQQIYAKAEAWSDMRALLERVIAAPPSASLLPEAARDARVLALCQLGELLLQRFDAPADARLQFEQALALDAGVARALRGLEDVALQTRDPAAVIEAYEREAEVTRDPARQAELARELSRRHQAEGRLDAAAAWAERTAEAAPSTESLGRCLTLHQLRGADADVRHALERLVLCAAPAEKPALWRRLGALGLACGDDHAAARALGAALALEPEDLVSLESLAALYARTDRPSDEAQILARLAERADPARRIACLDALARLRSDRLDDIAGAIAALERLALEPLAPPDTDVRLEALLERSGRLDALCRQLAARRERLAARPGESPDVRSVEQAELLAELDLRRAEALERLGRLEEAAPAYAMARCALPGEPRVLCGLERCARALGDDAALAAALAARAACAEPEEAAGLRLECARLLADTLDRAAEAIPLLAGLAAGDPASAETCEAAQRLERLLERDGAWSALRAHLEGRVLSGDSAQAFAAHERLARLCRDRLADAVGARLHFEAAAALRPERPELWQSLALLYAAAELPGELLRALEGELATEPDPERERQLCARAASLCAGPLGDEPRAEGYWRRVLAHAPAHPEACEFLAERFERAGRSVELAAVLDARLAAMEDADAASRAADAGRRASLRLRIARLRAESLGDPLGAVDALEPLLDEQGPACAAAEPLAALYTQLGHGPALEDLCRSAAAAADAPAARAAWLRRLGDGLATRGADGEAAEAYRGALAVRPDDDEVERALAHVLRRLGDAASLARLLESRLARAAGDDERPLRLELAALAMGPLGRPVDALPHLRRVLELEPGNSDALTWALAVARDTGRATEVLPAVDAAIASAPDSAARADGLARKAALLSEALGRPGEAAACWRDVLALDPTRDGVWEPLGEALAAAGDWPGALEALLARSERVQRDARAALLAQAADVAEARLAPEEALPWLERLHAERPRDAALRSRISALVRRCGRPAALLRALDDELETTTDPRRLRALHVERAQLLEGALAAPARASEAWERALEAAPDDAQALHELTRLSARLGRPREEAHALESWIPLAPPDERLPLRRRLATLHRDAFGDPGRAAEELARALDEAGGAAARTELLQALGDAHAAAGQRAAWARVAEEELARLTPGDAVFAERRRALHAELARAYAGALCDPDRALVHLRAIVDAAVPSGPDGGDAACAQFESERAEAETRLLALLRAERADVELATRLDRRLARRPEDPARWLELAQLREERLHDLPGAAAAYQQVLARQPGEGAALRGLRAVCERLGDFAGVAAALEGELAGLADAPPDDSASCLVRAALWRRLGEVAWRHLGSTTRASRAFAAALEADPRDEAALHALERLLEEMEDWRGAIALYESEIELHGDAAPARRREVWLRIAAIARVHAREAGHAIEAYEAAAALGALARDDRATLAALYAEEGDLESHVRVAASVCDDVERPGDAQEELALADALESLGRFADARARAERALAQDGRHLGVWDALARLREATGDLPGAAEALAAGAPLSAGPAAAGRMLRAAHWVEAGDPARAFDWLERATAYDPASALAQAALARVAATLTREEVAARAAARALECAEGLAPAERLATALLGARAARATNDLPASARLLDEALALAPDHEQALGTRAEIAHALGDDAGIRSALERWLDVASPDTPPSVRARRLTLLGRAVHRLGEHAEAHLRYEAAIACDATHEEAWSALVDLLDEQRRTGDAGAALELWADATPDPATRARCLLRAAERIPADPNLPHEAVRALALLEQAVASDPGAAGAWALRATRLWDAGRADEAREVATRGLEHVDDGPARAVLCFVRASGLETAGERRPAAQAYADAARLDPACVDAALACARLRRSLGEWREAATHLADFAAAFPDGPRERLAQVWLQLGRLRAGPLEDVAGALDAYEHAVTAQPSLREAREALAELLAHQPDRWDEACARHRELLEQEPTRLGSLRALLRIARGRAIPDAVETGLAILRALGAASPEERESAPVRLTLRIATRSTLENVVWERARRAVHEVSDEIAQALGAPRAPAETGATDPLSRFRDGVLQAEADLTAPGLSLLEPAPLGEVVRLVVQLAHDREQVSGDGPLVNALAGALGRWARRRVRKLLGDSAPEEVAEIDFVGWRAELRALACTCALDAGGGDLRAALCALVADAGGPPTLPDDADLCALVGAAPEARELLRRMALAFADAVVGRA